MVSWAEGKGKNLAKSKNRVDTWAKLKQSLSKPFVTPEFRYQFDKMQKDEQDSLKAINGWISGAQCKDGHRAVKNILPRDLLTIDVDYAPDTILDDITLGLNGIGLYEAFWHSSRRHTPEAPRVRLFMPMTRKVTVDEYIALVRFIAWKLDSDMKLVDVVSYRPAQMMFKPSCSKDDEKNYFKFEQFGRMLDPDTELAEFERVFGDWHNLNNLPKHPGEELRKRADKAEDPRQKAGPVGVFCRTYDIFQAMDTFLPGKYIPGDEHSGHPRFTYAGSTSSNGAIVYDDGLFMYSHHGHDPICDMNVNAFDLVRIHLFGEEDGKAKEGTTPTKMPSYVAMMDMLAKDPGYRSARLSEKFDLGEMFDDEPEQGSDPEDHDQEADDAGSAGNDGPDAEPADDLHAGNGKPGSGDRTIHDLFDDEELEGDGGSPEDDIEDVVGSARQERPRSEQAAKVKRPKRSAERKPKKDWFKEDLEFTENAEIKSTLYNVALIIQNDFRLVNAIRYNEFDKNVCLCRDIRPKTSVAPALVCRDPDNGDRWEDHHDITIRAVLESPNGEGKAGYGMRPTRADLYDGIVLAARATPYHPIRDYLLDCEEKWDRKERMDTYLIRYLDLKDSDYHRQVSRLMILASVVRIFEPGHKFDFAAILEGKTGIGKSWSIKALYGDRWFGELHAKLDEPQKVAEQITGKWGIELPELGSFHKADHNAAKAFMRRQHDDVRMAYDRRVSEFPRQCVCWGTTNDKKYLKDPTGNRSYWPIVTPRMEYVDIAGIAAERDQIWGEAVAVYFAMREAQPRGELPLHLQGREANAEAARLQDAARTQEMHEVWADAIQDWLDTPVTLRQFKEEIGAKISQAFDDDDNDDQSVMVRRAVFTQAQAIKYALNKQHGVVSDHSTTQNIAKAMDMLYGWSAPKATNDYGVTQRRVLGVKGRWIENTQASAQDRFRGYEIVQGDDDFDVI